LVFFAAFAFFAFFAILPSMVVLANQILHQNLYDGLITYPQARSSLGMRRVIGIMSG
jgi:hypothetical protein